MELYLLRITRIELETEDSKTYYLQSMNGLFLYKAGQFLTFLIDIDGKERRRSYSLSSAPEVDEQLCITIKRVQNGIISRYLFDHIKEGDVLKTLPPSGRFTLPDVFTNEYFFIAAGSGITPVFSLLKEVLYKRVDCSVTLISQNTSEATSIYRKQLLTWRGEFRTRFKWVEIFSQPVDRSFIACRLNNSLLEVLVKQYVHSTSIEFYLCGPIKFMRMAQFTLKVLGYADSQIRKENFVVDFVPPPPLISDTSAKEVVIHFNKHTYFLKVAYPLNILEAALQNNIQLPYSCRGGRCSTCTARCITGRVKMSINDVLTAQDLANGFILTCVAYAETDLELTFE